MKVKFNLLTTLQSSHQHKAESCLDKLKVHCMLLYDNWKNPRDVIKMWVLILDCNWYYFFLHFVLLYAPIISSTPSWSRDHQVYPVDSEGTRKLQNMTNCYPNLQHLLALLSIKYVFFPLDKQIDASPSAQCDLWYNIPNGPITRWLHKLELNASTA